MRDAIFFRKLSVMSIQHMKDEALALTPAERRELIGYLVGFGRERIAKSLSPADRSADFLAWADQLRPRVGLADAGRDAIYED